MIILIIISFMISGVVIGYFLRKKNLGYVHKFITVLIWVLLFLLGTEVGNNEKIINGLHTIGIEALIITLAGVIGSVLLSWILWLVVSKKKNFRNER